LADHHLQVEAVSMDEDGLDVEQLEKKLSRVKPKFINTIPTHHNPASVTLAQDRKERLAPFYAMRLKRNSKTNYFNIERMLVKKIHIGKFINNFLNS
jgi:hypothetical protein